MAESSQAVQYFPLAAQPDVVRSAQKDRLCLHILEASVTDVVQGLLGPAAVFRYRDALQALSAALYFGGSTGMGEQTLGEEYCELLQVTSGRLPASTLRRSMHVLLQALPPLLLPRLRAWTAAEGLAAEPDNASAKAPGSDAARSAGSEAGSACSEPAAHGTQNGNGAHPDDANRHNGNGVHPDDANRRGSGDSDPAHGTARCAHSGNGVGRLGTDDDADSQHAAEQPPGQGVGHAGSSRTPARETLSLRRTLALRTAPVARAVRGWTRRLQRAAHAHAPQAAVWAAMLVQLHLALFYLYGRFYQLPKRATGTSYVYVGSSFTPRHYYGVMGVLLAVQLAVQTYQHVRSTSGPDIPTDSTDLQVLDENGGSVAVDDRKAGASEGEAVAPLRRCPLCLSNRVVSTAARCGHVFCWKCIVQWCQQKKECPICRASMALQDLVPLAGFDPPALGA